MSKIVIGQQPDGKQLRLDLDQLIPSRLLIQANSGGGKSWLLRRIAEQLYGKVQTIIIDPEGEFFTLRENFGYVLVGENGETPCDLRSAAMLAERFLTLKASAVCDLYESFRSRPMERRQWVRLFLNALIDAPRNLWHPLVVIVDEAHKFCPQESPKAASMEDREIIGGCKDAMIALSTTGRKRGFCAIWATQRLAKLDKDASSEFFNRMVGMTIEDVDVDRAADLMSVPKDEKQKFRQSLRTLVAGQFYAFGRALTIDRTLVDVGEVQTRHPESGKQASASTPPPMPDVVKKFLPQLSDLPAQAEEKARTEAEYKREIRDLNAQLKAVTRQRQAPPAAAASAKPDPAQIKMQAEKLLGPAKSKIDTAWANAVRAFQREIERRISEGAKQLAGAVHATPFVAPNETPAIAVSATIAPLPTAPMRIMQPRLPAAPAADRTTDPSGFKPSALHRKIGGILAAYYPDPVDKAWLASMCGKTLGGGWNGRLSEVRAAGLLEDVEGGSLRATPRCASQYAGVFTPPATTEEAIAVWDHKLSDTHRAILNRLIEANGEPVTKDELAAAAGKALGGGFNGRLSELRSTGLMLDAGCGLFRANKKALFLNGEAA